MGQKSGCNLGAFWFIVELITESLDVVPVGLLIQRIGGFVCEKATEKKNKQTKTQNSPPCLLLVQSLELLLARSF